LCGGDFLTDGFAKLALRSLKALIWITLAGQKMNTTTQRLMESVKALPEPLVAEVLDFADFLRARQLNPSSNTQDPELSSLSGGWKIRSPSVARPWIFSKRCVMSGNSLEPRFNPAHPGSGVERRQT
jgi:hypothetical protein